MNLRKNSLLLALGLSLLTAVTWAQLPIRGTRWRAVLPAPGNFTLVLTFRADSLLVTAEAGNVLLETIRYAHTGDTLQLQTLVGRTPCGAGVVGLYRLNYVQNGEQFTLQPIRDDCMERQSIFASKTPFVRVRSNPNQPPRNWPYLDPTTDSVAGISLYRAYERLNGQPSVPVVVGVLDSGVDLTHEDLKDVAWVNPAETPGNALDDDKNGHTDDLNGWNFMGAPDGTTYEYDQPEIAQTYLLLRSTYDKANPTTLSPTQKRQYTTYLTAKKQFLPRYQANRTKRLAFADTARFWRVAEVIRQKLPDSVTTQQAMRSLDLETDSVTLAVRTLLADSYDPSYGSFGRYVRLIRQHWIRFRQWAGGEADIAYNPDYNARKAVGDDPANPTQRYYGSATMRLGQSEQLAVHGSHVAGIIGAKRGNGRGIDGVADNVRIMVVSVVPANGDERDKDVANGIRYAVENGAKVINLSFGKRLSPFKEQVDAAIRFAEEHDVLIVRAAGNNGENIDSVVHYPSARYENGQTAQNVLTVGNSTWRVGEDLASRSSNYGLQTVDLFAPGTDILSTLPNDRYASFSGTSMASPMTAGVAALLRSYFPQLTAVEVKDILIKSSFKPDQVVRKPGRLEQKVPFESLSRSGGVLNAYEAVIRALDKRQGIKK